MGMSYSEYWERESELVICYREANKLKQQVVSNNAWLQGMYFYQAMGTIMANAFSSKGTPPETYLDEPINVIPKTNEEIEAEKQASIEADREKVIAYFTEIGRNFRASKGSEDG